RPRGFLLRPDRVALAGGPAHGGGNDPHHVLRRGILAHLRSEHRGGQPRAAAGRLSRGAGLSQQADSRPLRDPLSAAGAKLLCRKDRGVVAFRMPLPTCSRSPPCRITTPSSGWITATPAFSTSAP